MRAMRRQDRKLEPADVREILTKGDYGTLSTVTPDGAPYGVPISYAYDEETNAVYKRCSVEGGQKIDNILANPNACFTVVTDVETLPEKFSTRYRSVVLFGKVEIVEGVERKKFGLKLLAKKYAPAFEEKGLKYIDSAVDSVHVLKLSVAEAAGKGRQ